MRMSKKQVHKNGQLTVDNESNLGKVDNGLECVPDEIPDEHTR